MRSSGCRIAVLVVLLELINSTDRPITAKAGRMKLAQFL